MRHAFTAVLERNAVFTADFATEPYETGWATEARWFVRALSFTGDNAALILTPQLSLDGLVWCDADCAPLELREPGMVTCALRDFGHCLRLDCALHGDSAEIKVLICLALKERAHRYRSCIVSCARVAFVEAVAKTNSVLS